MRGLLNFLYRYRIFGFFLFLEIICIWLLVSYNNYYNAFYFNSSNQLAGTIQSKTANTIDYAKLRKQNEELAAENLELRRKLFSVSVLPKQMIETDNYEVILAKVVNNSVLRSANYITINRGSKDGMQPGMGVISSKGVVGIVKSTSKNYSTVTSLLHQNLMISSQVLSTGTLGTTQWDALDPQFTKLHFIPKHEALKLGDTIITSGFNAVFPKGIHIGKVESFDSSEESAFYDARIKISNDFSSLDFVNVIKHELKEEKDSLELDYGQN